VQNRTVEFGCNHIRSLRMRTGKEPAPVEKRKVCSKHHVTSPNSAVIGSHGAGAIAFDIRSASRFEYMTAVPVDSCRESQAILAGMEHGLVRKAHRTSHWIWQFRHLGEGGRQTE